MFDHLSIGVADLGRSKTFYDAALRPLGVTCLHESDSALGYGSVRPMLWMLRVERPVPSDPESGLHLCFAAPSEDAVAEFHRAAMLAEGRDNGMPGLRPDYGPGYFAAFALDPDGYRIEVLHQAQP